MIEELNRLFKKKFSYQITICPLCNLKTNQIMVEGEENIIAHIICKRCNNKQSS